MNKSTLASILAIGLLTSPAIAADLAVKAPVRPVAPIAYNWSGFYIGGNAGYSWGRSKLDHNLLVDDGVDIDSYTTAGSVKPKGFIGGGQIGYNWQLNSVVFGLELDVAHRNNSAEADLEFLTSDPTYLYMAEFSSRQRWVGTFRPRLGYAADNWLLYVTGGLAFGGFKHSYRETIVAADVLVADRLASDSKTKLGWTVGGGVEVGFSRNWSLGVEYLYMAFEKTTLTLSPVVFDGNVFTSKVSFDDSSHVLRAKLNYRF
jgi:outer membrane immunogenic protein